jgi:WD40 repeat protein
MKKAFERRAICISSLLIPLWNIAAFAATGQAEHVTEAKGHPMQKVATKILSFNDDAFATSATFSPDGTELATEFCQQFQVRIWKWRNQPKVIATLAKPAGSLSVNVWDALRYSSDGKYVSVFHGRTSIPPAPGSFARVWDRNGLTVAHDFMQDQLGLGGGAIAFIPGGREVLVALNGSSEKRGGPRHETLQAYDVSSWQVSWNLDLSPLAPSSVEVSPNGIFAAVGGNFPTDEHAIQSRVAIVDIAQRRIVRMIDPFPLRCSMERMSWSADGKRLAIGSMQVSGLCPMDGTSVAVFDVDSGKQISEDRSSIASHVNGIRYTADGKYLIEGGLGQTIRIWDAMQQTLLQEIKSDASAIAVTNDGRNLAVANGNEISVWELK